MDLPVDYGLPVDNGQTALLGGEVQGNQGKGGHAVLRQDGCVLDLNVIWIQTELFTRAAEDLNS